ncbi:hypothetical protein [Flexithrix dorotheae]|uniref:hypothetical protein n=1 Tax=Flexithrix dorotheae TaxID=70993 RepID=UPI000371B3FE|nr:hypothetical protein [Flexithrix dorotheae]
MKKLILLVFSAFFALQGFSQAEEEIELLKYLLNQERKIVLAENMYLSEAEEQVFWPIYEQYASEREGLSQKRFDLLKNYAEKFDTMTDEDANNIMKEIFTLQGVDLKLRKKYYKQMNKQLPAKVAARFLQIDDYLNSVVKLSVIDELPMIGDDKVPIIKLQ